MPVYFKDYLMDVIDRIEAVEASFMWLEDQFGGPRLTALNIDDEEINRRIPDLDLVYPYLSNLRECINQYIKEEEEYYKKEAK